MNSTLPCGFVPPALRSGRLTRRGAQARHGARVGISGEHR